MLSRRAERLFALRQARDRLRAGPACLRACQRAADKNPAQDRPREKVSEKTEQKKIVYKTIDNKNKIIQYIENHGRSGIADISKHIGLSKARTRVLLNELITEGKIITEGESRATSYGIKP